MEITKTNIKVGIQGVKGAFHDIAAQKFFNIETQIIQCKNFEELTQEVSTGKLDYALMAIENTVAGSILPNYALIQKHPVKIVGEEYLRIKQNLVGLPGQQLENLEEVHSHYMALAQCREFLDQRPGIRLVESEDTAKSAQEIGIAKIKNRAGIASELAAKLYGLEILAEEIETNKKNYTRFLVLTHQNNETTESKISKASICFSIPHETGSLSTVLGILSYYNLDLTKIQSMPIIGKEFQYFFFVDLCFTDYNKFKDASKALKPFVNGLQILGEYEQSIDTLEKIHQQIQL